MKKKVISVLLAGLMVLGLAGCQGGTSEQESKTEGSSGDGGKTAVKLVVWSSGAAENFQKGADAFNSRQDKIDFQIEMQTGDYNQYLGQRLLPMTCRICSFCTAVCGKRQNPGPERPGVFF